MTYTEALNYINNSLTSGSVYGLSRIKELLYRLSNPEKDMRIIHVAGTNGKGSVSRMLMSILHQAGYNVGIFNSPYLESMNEYLCVNGVTATDDEYALIAGIVKNAVEGVFRDRGNDIERDGQAESDSDRTGTDRLYDTGMVEKPTEFEFSFAMAMEYFSRKNCDFAIVECGLGGLTDATNVFEEKELSIITNIGKDHIKLLGDNIRDIAKQKAGIINKYDTVIAYPSEKEALDEIKKKCRQKKAELIIPDYIDFNQMAYYNIGLPKDMIAEVERRAGDVFGSLPIMIDSISLDGTFQKKNGIVAVSAALALISKGYRIKCKDIIKGLKNVTWPGRFETLCKKPLVIADGGHNVQCTEALCVSLDRKNIRKAIFVIGIMADKDYRKIFKMLLPYAELVIATEPHNDRRLCTEDIRETFCELMSKESLIDGNDIAKVIREIKEPSDAVREALRLDLENYNNKMPIIVTGSLYMMGDIRKVFKNH